MDGDGLFDANAVIAFVRDDQALDDRLSRFGTLAVPSIVIGELCFGARKSARVEDNLAQIDAFAAALEVLPCDEDTGH